MTSASSLAALRASTVASTLTMFPLRVPRLGARPLPTTSMPPLSSRWPMSTPTLEEPMSIPTK